MFNKSLGLQVFEFKSIILRNKYIKEIIENHPFPDDVNWYLGAGCVCQSVWNHLSGKEITEGIKDYDLVYYDASDLSKEAEEKEKERIQKKFENLDISIDVVNEARVHIWFEKDFGEKIGQLKSCEDAISHWPTTASSIGINFKNGELNIFAPYGLNDLFGMIVRQNSSVLSMNNYGEKVERWTKKWPKLTVVPRQVEN